MKIIIDLTSTLDKLERSVRAEQKAKESAKRDKVTRSNERQNDSVASDLTMRLMTKEDNDDLECTKLEMDVASYLKSLLASGKKNQAVMFLNDNKHRFTPDMKDTLTDIINKGL